MRIRINKFRLASPKISKPVKILVLSDIHNNHLALDSLLELAKKNAPDYICLAGDTLDQADADTEEIVNWLKSVSQIAKVVIGLGNHELMARSRRFRRSHGENVDFYVAVAKIKNCVLLKDRFCVYNASKQLTFSALNMPRSWYVSGEPKAEFKEVLKNIPLKALDGSRFNILLSHSPNGWLRGSKLLSRREFRIMNKLDLILSGHNHGGLVPAVLRPILRSRGFVGPKYKIAQPHAFGRWTDGKTSLLLSNGVTKFAETSGLSVVGRFLNKLYIPDAESILLVPGKEYKLVKER